MNAKQPAAIASAARSYMRVSTLGRRALKRRLKVRGARV